jgi:hypothetical protein
MTSRAPYTKHIEMVGGPFDEVKGMCSPDATDLTLFLPNPAITGLESAVSRHRYRVAGDIALYIEEAS